MTRSLSRNFIATSEKLYAIASRMLRRADGASDARQEVYVRIWTQSARYDAEKGNRSTGWRRSSDMFVSTCCGGMRATLCRVQISKPSRKPFLRTTLHHRYHRCLKLLEAAQSKAILMAFHFGLSHAEFSAACARNSSTAVQ